MNGHGIIRPKQGQNDRQLYPHQKEAMKALDLLDREPSFSTMIVLPTGGGKTYTAVNWLLRRAVAKRKKVLWIAHRHLLLDQAASSFADYAFEQMMPGIRSFRYRIVSGQSEHKQAASISFDDDVIVASKDSLRSKLDKVESWLSNESEAYLVVDEAHHATAKTYRNLIEAMQRAIPHLKVIGLTATPFRTLEKEQGLLSKIFKDGVSKGRVVKGDVGIAYQIGLQDLINSFILARPHIDTCDTNESFGETLDDEQIELMRRFDRIPEHVAKKMAESSSRNQLIVRTYAENREKYGKTILFAIDIAHAVALQSLFERAGVKSGYVVSALKDDDTGKMLPKAHNDDVVRRYRDGDLEVIINVNILTEGVDLPKTQSVFLARPTSSTILMTQMVGRALRGTKAGGTAECYIVTFVDGWDERVAWVNPTSLYSGGAQFAGEPSESSASSEERTKADVRAISISMIQQFAEILDNGVDTTLIEAIPFIERIPLGMYVFSYSEQGDESAEGADVSCQVMVYTSTKSSYEHLMESLPSLVQGYGLDEVDFAPSDVLRSLVKKSEEDCFSDDLVPPYRVQDIESILRYYIQFGESPRFYPFQEIDRSKLDVGAIARTIYDKDMGVQQRAAFENRLWDDGDENLLRLLFISRRNFMHAIDMEMRKLTNPEEFVDALAQARGERDSGGDVKCRASSEATSKAENEDESGAEGVDLARSQSGGESLSAAESGREKAAEPRKRAGETLERTEAQLHPDKARWDQMREYHSAGLVVSDRTGRPFLRFNGQAREEVDQGRLVLYSREYRVAELDPEGFIHLLSYELDGARRGWDAGKNSVYHVSDFVAFHLNMKHGLQRKELEGEASRQASRLRIARVGVVEEADGNMILKDVPSAANPAALRSDGKASIPTQSGRSGTSQAAQEAAPRLSKAVCEIETVVPSAEPPSLLSERDFEKLKPLQPSGLVNRRANTPYETFGGKARVLERGGCEYLYAKGSGSSPIKIARWSDADGLVLYEYDGGRGWYARGLSCYSRDFASQKFKYARGVSTLDLRERAESMGGRVRISYMRTPSYDDGLIASEKLADKVPSVSVSSSTRVFKGVQGPSRSLASARTVVVKNGYHDEEMSLKDISCVKSKSSKSCMVFTRWGQRRELMETFDAACARFLNYGFVRLNTGYLANVDAITQLSDGSVKEAQIKGVPMKVYVSDDAFETLIQQGRFGER